MASIPLSQVTIYSFLLKVSLKLRFTWLQLLLSQDACSNKHYTCVSGNATLTVYLSLMCCPSKVLTFSNWFLNHRRAAQGLPSLIRPHWSARRKRTLHAYRRPAEIFKPIPVLGTDSSLLQLRANACQITTFAYPALRYLFNMQIFIVNFHHISFFIIYSLASNVGHARHSPCTILRLENACQLNTHRANETVT